MRTTMPPLAVPSSLVSATPVRPIVSWNILACAKPFWPVGASRTISDSWGAPGACRWMTRLSLASSSMRFVLVCSRPAVSMISASALRAIAAFSASKTTAAGSEPAAWRTTSTSTRWPHVSSCSMAAARNVSAAASSTCRPSALRAAASLAHVVVLPEPLTPSMRITLGRASSASGRAGPRVSSRKRRSTGRS